jgi:GNAT superfamily N-acetyltransferase
MTDPFALIAATWPPEETVSCGPWTLRRGGGGGSRVSAATLDGPFAGLEAAEAAMRGWGQRPLVMIRPGETALDADLAARGWTRDKATTIRAAPVDMLAWDAPDERAIDCDGPLACMARIWDAGGIGPGRQAVMDRAAGPRAWLLARTGDAPAACGFIALQGDAAMFHALEVEAAHRREGHAARLTRAAAAWARDRGAVTLALAVTDDNAPARALYDRLGMAEAARYHYRLAPEA